MSETSSSSTSNDRRAQQVCGFGLAVQLLVLVVILAVSVWSGSEAIWAESVHLAGGAGIWLALLVMYTQRRRARAEAFETEELRRAAEAGASTAIFSEADESLHIERIRLKWVYRWFLPGITVVLALFHIGMYARWHVQFAKPLADPRWSLSSAPSLAATFMAFAGFFCFLFSRYASGMARQEHWRMLRAASTYLAGNALACLVLVGALGFRLLNQPLAEPVAAYVIWIGVLILGLEFAVNFVLDLYRPRVLEGEFRPAFDSRLLALVSEPGGVARSIAEAINYQFGFEVSATWFYQLLQRSLLPLAVFSLMALVALSAVVIVDIDQQAVVERFGEPVQGSVMGPGIHFKLPWPIDKVYRQSVTRIKSLEVGTFGSDEHGQEEGEDHEEEHPIELWTEKHEYAPHMMILVANPEEAGQSSRPGVEAESAGRVGRAVGVSMIKGSVAIEYRTDRLEDYLYTYQDPEAVLKAVAFQVLTDYAAGVSLDHLIGPHREEFENELRARIQKRIDALKLGIDIAFLGLQGAHPPSEQGVAAAFQNVVAAESRKDAAIEQARGEAQQIRTRVAGSVEGANRLDAAIQEMDRLAEEEGTSAEALAAARQDVEDLLLGNPAKGITPMSGVAASQIAIAESGSTVSVARAESKRTLFENDVQSYESAPALFKIRRYLQVWTRAVQEIRKIVVLADLSKTRLIIELETQRKGGLDFSEPDLGGN
ncbi:MAG: SPFH domain-containing protein [Phycisphaerae bacterium]